MKTTSNDQTKPTASTSRGIFRLTAEAGLPSPEIDLSEGFKVILWRPSSDQVSDQVGDQVSDQVDELIKRVIRVVQDEMAIPKIMGILQLKHRTNFRENYLKPALHEGYVEMTNPDSPRSPKQKYRLTPKGQALQKRLES